MTWSNRDEDCKNANSLFQWRFRCQRRPRILRSLKQGVQGRMHAQNGIFDSILDTSSPKPDDKQDDGRFVRHITYDMFA